MPLEFRVARRTLMSIGGHGKALQGLIVRSHARATDCGAEVALPDIHSIPAQDVLGYSQEPPAQQDVGGAAIEATLAACACR